jgi:hypothetical protein
MTKGFIYSDQMPLFGHRDVIGFGDISMQVRVIPRDIANDVIVKNHYSGKITSLSYIHLGVFIDNAMHGVLQFGYAMNPASGGSVVKNTDNDGFLELNRMWLSDDAPRNSESMAIAYSIKYIKHEYKKVDWIQSFADERCGGLGIVYQAANFEYYGEHTSVFWELDNSIYHNIIMTRKEYLTDASKYLQANKDRAKKLTLRQFRYIYWINRRRKKDVLLKQCEYPKHYLEVK